MTPEQLVQHRELEFLRACGTGNKARILERAVKLREARRYYERAQKRKKAAA